MSFTLRQLRAFVTIARVESFTRAAGMLNVSQPALTMQIRQLEAVLGVRLFDRNTRRVRLTQIGTELAPGLERLVLEMDAVLVHTRGLAGRSRGTVRLAALPSMCATVVPQAMMRFREDHPGVAVVARDIVARRVIAAVRAEEVDFGIGSVEGPAADLVLTPLLTDRMTAVLPPGHALARARTVSLRSLVPYPIIMLDRESSVRQLLDRAFAGIGRIVPAAYEPVGMSTAVGMVRAGLGLTILPSTAPELAVLGGLAARPIRDRAVVRQIAIIEKHGRSRQPAAEVFIHAIREAARAFRPGQATVR